VKYNWSVTIYDSVIFIVIFVAIFVAKHLHDVNTGKEDGGEAGLLNGVVGGECYS